VRLENVLALTHGSLMSQPHISLFNDIVIEASRVKRGSLFVALKPHDISQAIEKGAYGIVYERDLEFDDKEIAWIKVDDSYDALKRLVRFILIDKELVAFTCKPIILQVAKQFTTSNEFIVLEGSLSDNFSKLLSATPKSTLLFVESQIKSDLFTNASRLSDSSVEDKIRLLEHTLFEMAFIYRDTYYERQMISPLFIPYMEQLLALFHKQNISYKIKPFVNIPHFHARFVNSALHVRDFGTTNRVIIFENDATLIEEEIAFISQNAPWAHSFSLSCDDLSEKEVIKILRAKHFNFALLSGVEATFLDNESNYLRQQTLF